MLTRVLNQIPGHVQGYTWILALVAGITGLMASGRWTPAFGMLIVVLGAFLGDQATHLFQHHDDEPPTWLEAKMKSYPDEFQIAGLFIVAFGIWISFK